MTISIGDVWTVRIAAIEWLKEHPDSINAPGVNQAIANIEPFLVNGYREIVVCVKP